MPNAQEIKINTARNILIFGNTGAGKTQQFATLPGKKFAYLFDPNAIDTLKGCDIDYEEFLPNKLDLSLYSLKKGVPPSAKSKLTGVKEYERWQDHLENGMRDGFFDQYDNIMMDSLTTFSDMIMDSILKMNGRAGQWPNQDDWGPQMNAIMKVFRVMTAMGKCVYVTGHMEMVKDETSQRVFYQPIVTGKLKSKLPLLFSQIFYANAEMNKTTEQVVHQIQTKPDRLTPLIRCTLKNLEYQEDVTLNYNKPLESQGLGKILIDQERITEYK